MREVVNPQKEFRNNNAGWMAVWNRLQK